MTQLRDSRPDIDANQAEAVAAILADRDFGLALVTSHLIARRHLADYLLSQSDGVMEFDSDKFFAEISVDDCRRLIAEHERLKYQFIHHMIESFLGRHNMYGKWEDVVRMVRFAPESNNQLTAD